jgi:NAD(P)H-dependent FMN reductase
MHTSILKFSSVWHTADLRLRGHEVKVKQLLIVYHTLTGGTLQMARAAAGGYLFACPENLAAMSGLMKDFFDRSYYPVLEQLQGRPYAILICAGSDGSNAARQIERIATGWRLKAIADPIIVCTHAQTPEQILAPKQIVAADLARCEELGATIAAGLDLGIY